MRIAVCDKSCLIDLRKAALLGAFLRLPHEILIPNTLFDGDLAEFSDEEKVRLRAAVEIVDLPGERVWRARELARGQPRLTIHNAFGFVLAKSSPGCAVLASDSWLLELAASYHLSAYSLLWVIDEIHANKGAALEELRIALRTLVVDPSMRLPRSLVAAAVRRYESMITAASR